MCVDVPGSSTAVGMPTQQWESNGTNAQKPMIETAGLAPPACGACSMVSVRALRVLAHLYAFAHLLKCSIRHTCHLV